MIFTKSGEKLLPFHWGVYSYGFDSARKPTVVFESEYMNARNQISQQDNYLWTEIKVAEFKFSVAN